jgi:thymidine kinase
MDVRVTSPEGRIEMITGCMFSGKTGELIRRAQKAEISGDHVIGLKPDIDDRYEKNAICSHTGVNIDAIPIRKDDTGLERARRSLDIHDQIVEGEDINYNLTNDSPYNYETINIQDSSDHYIPFDRDNGKIDVIVIDEVNLFESEIVDFVSNLADDNYRVILSGLDLTFRGEPFNPTPQLLSLSDHVEKRQAVCESCGCPATRTQRLINGDPAPYDSPTIDVGGDEKYEPRCRKCHDVPTS